MPQIWRVYIALWTGSFGEMPRLVTFCCRICLLLWHAAVCIALMGILYGVTHYPYHKLFYGW